VDQPFFKKGDSVTLRSTLEMGRTEGEPQLEGGEYWYRVRFVKRVESVVEDHLDAISEPADTLESLVSQGMWGRLQAVRCALGIERIAHTNRSTIYAFQSQRILFEPYQYKTLLKVLDSPDRRVLIADEVGLGKTIETGLVLTELNARRPLERVLIVCPSRLREKWRNELNGKFDQDFDILDKRAFLQAASRAQESPSRFRLRGIMSMQSMRGDEVRESLTSELGHIDMVIVAVVSLTPVTARSAPTSALRSELLPTRICPTTAIVKGVSVSVSNRSMRTARSTVDECRARIAGVFRTNSVMSV